MPKCRENWRRKRRRAARNEQRRYDRWERSMDRLRQRSWLPFTFKLRLDSCPRVFIPSAVKHTIVV